MSPKDRLKLMYRRTLLPAIRSGATPCFRFAVKMAARTGLLPQAANLAGDRPEHFTIIHLSNHVGDTVMLLPMIEALRAAHPRALIECVVQAPIATFLGLIPSLDHVHEIDVGHGPTTTPWLELQRTLSILRSYWQSMRRVRPTTCIVPRWGSGFRDLMLSYLLQAPNRIGFASSDFDQSRPPAGYRDTLLTCRVRGAQGMTEPARFLFLLEKAGLIPPTDPRAIGSRPNASILHIASTVDWPALAARLGVDPDARLAVLAPGASAPRRMWPIDRWAAAMDELFVSGFTVALLAGGSDAHVARQLYDLTPVSRRSQTALVAGITNLQESTCLIAQSQLFMGNDSGPGHIAGALCVPCVILFIAAEGADPDGPSAPERVRPMGKRVVCCRPKRTIAPCSGYCTADCPHCILQIEPDEIRHAIRSLMHTPAHV